MTLSLSSWLAIASGIGVAAASGFRAFLPLLALGIAGRLGLIELRGSSEWLEHDPALICFGVAAFLEILADKIPVLDHALDAVGTIIRPIAAWLGAYAVLAHWPTPWGQIVALILGGGALALHLAKAKLRLGSSAITLGHANPVLSVAEDATTLVLLVVAVLAPILAVLFVLLLVLAIRRIRRSAARRPSPEGLGSRADSL